MQINAVRLCTQNKVWSFTTKARIAIHALADIFDSWHLVGDRKQFYLSKHVFWEALCDFKPAKLVYEL